MYVKVVSSGRFTEIYRYEREPSIVRRSARKAKPRDGFRGFARRSGANLARARKGFYRLVWANLAGSESPALITLTMRDVVGIDVGYKCLTGYMAGLRRSVGSGFRYLAVPEYQKRGAVHFHILVWGLAKETIENERRNRYLQNLWALGYVDCVSTDGSAKLAGYLAKYMSKSMQDYRIAGKKAYAGSRNLVRPVSVSSYDFSALPGDFWTGDKRVLTRRDFQTQWMGAASYQLIESSYGES